MDFSRYVGKEYPPFTIAVESRRIVAFARAIGETDPIYSDEESARSAGYDGIPAPLTFPFTLTLEAGQSFNVLEDMGIDRTRSVHGAQGFRYHRPIYGGDTVSGRQKIVDIFEKKGGALVFILTETALANQHGEPVCDLTSTIVVRNG